MANSRPDVDPDFDSDKKPARRGLRWPGGLLSTGRVVLGIQALIAIVWIQPWIFHALARDGYPLDGWRNSLAAIFATLGAALSVIVTYFLVRQVQDRARGSSQRPLPTSDANALRELLTRVANQISLFMLGSRKDRELGGLFSEMEASAERACTLAESLESNAAIHEGGVDANLVVIFEKDPQMRRRFRSELVERGFSVLAFESAELTLQAIDAQSSEILIACVCWDGRSFEGPEVVAGMRRRRPDLPVLILCEGVVSAEEASGLLLGPGRVLAKRDMTRMESMEDLVREIRLWQPGKTENA